MRVYFLSLITIAGLCTCNAVIFTEQQTKDIEEFAETVLRCHDVPGATIAVVKGNETWTLPLGYADVEAKRKVTEKNLFGVGSITKSFTASLLALLVQESDGNITFDTPVTTFLGQEYGFADKTRAKHLSIKDVLTHRTGFPTLNLALMFGSPEGFSREDFAKKLSDLPASKPFRDEYAYSNIMYMFAGHITEKLLGASWEDNLKTKLLDKIGMTNTEAMTKEEELTGERYARPYAYMRGGLERANTKAFIIDQFGPAGSLASSGEDMIKFMRFLLRKGKLEDGTQLIKETMFEEMWNPIIPVSSFMRPMVQKLAPTWPVADVSMGYGLGWFVNAYRGYRSIFHPGGLHSYSSMMQIFPELDMGLFMAINGPTPTPTSLPLTNIMAVLYYMSDILLGEKPWLDKDLACSYPKPWFDMAALFPPVPERKPVKPEHPLVKYTGTYFNPLVGVLVISLDKSTSELQIKLNLLDGVLVPEENGMFAIEARGDLEFLTWAEKANPLFLFKAKFLEGDDTIDGVEIMSNPPLEPAIKFQIQTEDDMEPIDQSKTEL